MTPFRLSIRVPIVLTPVLLNITLDIGFQLDHIDDLGTGLHQFELGQHTLAARKVLKARVDQHQVITSAGAAPSLGDAAMLTALDGVSLPSNLEMSWGGAIETEGDTGHLVGTVTPHRDGHKRRKSGAYGKGDKVVVVQSS